MGNGTPAAQAVFRPVQRSTTLEETVNRLGTAIRLGVLAPGSQLPPERDLADQLRINRSTLRQALTTLVRSGHIVSLWGGGGGTFVADTPPLSMGNPAKPHQDGAPALLDHRVAIEIGATVLAAERAEPVDLDVLDEPVALMADAKTFEDYRRADVRFHTGLARAARSPRLVTAMTDVHGQMTDLTARIPHLNGRLKRSNGEHLRLVQLIRRGDPSPAVLLMRGHIERTEKAVLGWRSPCSSLSLTRVSASRST